jgi:hypothetical protein
LTGIFEALATWTASLTKSLSNVARRPKPPPRNVVWILTCSGFSPAILAAFAWSPVWNCVPVQTSPTDASMVRSTAKR